MIGDGGRRKIKSRESCDGRGQETHCHHISPAGSFGLSVSEAVGSGATISGQLTVKSLAGPGA